MSPAEIVRAARHRLKARHVRTFRARLDGRRRVVTDELEHLPVRGIVDHVYLARVIFNVQAAEYAGAMAGIPIPQDGSIN